jgi:hypothetical protein
VQDSDGKTQTLRIGYIGFVPPQIMTWDKANLSGKVTVNDITETARKYVPEMREKGADVVVVVAHSGLSADPYQAMAENSVYYLSQFPAWMPLCSATPTRSSGQRLCQHQRRGYRERDAERRTGGDAGHVGRSSRGGRSGAE